MASGDQGDFFGKEPKQPKTPRYPERAGYTEPTTSKEAADAIEASGRATTLRDRVAEWFKAGNRSTVHQLASALKEPVSSVQPRVSELRAKGMVVECGRARNQSGVSACIWKWK